MSNEGKSVKVHYTGTLDDGTKFDSSLDRGEPLAFTCMAGQMIPGFDAAVNEMEVGEKRTVKIPAADAYGEYHADQVHVIEFEKMPFFQEMKVGQRVMLSLADGRQVPARAIEKDEETITLDMNHELAGKDLTFEIELLEAE